MVASSANDHMTKAGLSQSHKPETSSWPSTCCRGMSTLPAFCCLLFALVWSWLESQNLNWHSDRRCSSCKWWRNQCTPVLALLCSFMNTSRGWHCDSATEFSVNFQMKDNLWACTCHAMVLCRVYVLIHFHNFICLFLRFYLQGSILQINYVDI